MLAKFHIRTRLIETFPTTYRFWRCAEEKLHFTPVHTLRQLKRDEGLFPPTRRVVVFQARYVKKTARRFGGGPNLDSVQPRFRKNSASHLFWTCPNRSTIQWPCTLVAQCHFLPFRLLLFFALAILLKLHILTRLIESFPMVHGLWHCIEVNLSIPLGARA